MKKNRLLLIVATIALTCGSLVAQNTKEGKRLTEEQRIEKRVQRMQERLCLDDETSAKFAPLYKAYIQEMKACHKAPDPNIKKESRTDEQIKAQMKEHFERQQKMLDTQEKYFNEFQNKMIRITDVSNGKVVGRENDEQRIVIYDGGIAVHDLYFAMKILEKVGDNCIQIPMSYPTERFWI